MNRYTLCTIFHKSLFKYPPILHKSSFHLTFSSHFSYNVPPLTFHRKVSLIFSRDNMKGQRAVSHFTNSHPLSGCKVTHKSLLLSTNFVFSHSSPFFLGWEKKQTLPHTPSPSIFLY